MEFNLRAIFETDSRRRCEMIDVIAKRFFSGDSAGRCMRLAQVTAVFELGHYVAHHRGAHAELMARDDLRGADRLGGRNEFLHRRENKRVLPVREIVAWRLLRHLIGSVSILLRIERYIQGPP